jgi:hypothetical protein
MNLQQQTGMVKTLDARDFGTFQLNYTSYNIHIGSIQPFQIPDSVFRRAVYTVTDCSTIQRSNIVINGETVNYIGERFTLFPEQIRCLPDTAALVSVNYSNESQSWLVLATKQDPPTMSAPYGTLIYDTQGKTSLAASYICNQTTKQGCVNTTAGPYVYMSSPAVTPLR